MKSRRKIFAGLCLALFLSGCGGVEPEKRSYPLVMAADHRDGEYIISYGMPDLPVSTGQEKSEENGDPGSCLVFRGRTLEEIRELYDSSQEKYLDRSHLKVLILGSGLTGGGKWAPFLCALREDPSVGEDLYVFQADEILPVMELNGKLSSSLGAYILGIYENRPPDQRKEGVSLRAVYGSMLEEGKLPALPRLTAEEGVLRVTDPERAV